MIIARGPWFKTRACRFDEASQQWKSKMADDMPRPSTRVVVASAEVDESLT